MRNKQLRNRIEPKKEWKRLT